MTTGEESDDEAEEDYSSNREEGGNETGGNDEEVVIISFPTSRKRAYSVCLYISSPTATSPIDNPLNHPNTIRKSQIPRLILPKGITNVFPNAFVLSHNPYSNITRTPLLPTLKMQNFPTSRIPRPIAPSNFFRHANNFSFVCMLNLFSSSKKKVIEIHSVRNFRFHIFNFKVA